jgi:hypothetical protein
MARQTDKCWRCGADWVSTDAPPRPLRVISGGAAASVPAPPRPRIAAQAAIQADLDADRWMDEGGSLGSEATARRPRHAV